MPLAHIDEVLASRSAQRPSESLQLGIWDHGRVFARGVGPRADDFGSYALGNYRSLLGCITKMMTATLVARAVAEKRLRFDDECAPHLPDSPESLPVKHLLEGVRICHLLNHTHGIDDSGFDATPFDEHGSIDLKCALSAGHVTRIAPPGEHFHYGRIGSWIAASILEFRCERPYTALLRELVIPRSFAAGTASSAWPAAPVCPGNGGDSRLTVSDVLGFVSIHLPSRSREAGASLAALRERVFDTPGWFPYGRRICLGLSDYGGGWFGHNSTYRNTALLIRFKPEDDIAIAVASDTAEGAHAAIAAMKLKGHGDTGTVKSIQLLTKQQWMQTSADRYVGRFDSANRRYEVLRARNGLLHLLEFSKCNGRVAPGEAPVRNCLLRPAEKHIFFPVSDKFTDTPFLQFLGQRGDLKFEYLQTGKQIHRRAQGMSAHSIASISPPAHADSAHGKRGKLQSSLLDLHGP